MISTEQTLKEMKYVDEILDIIDNKDEFTQSDLQGVLGALVKKIIANK